MTLTEEFPRVQWLPSEPSVRRGGDGISASAICEFRVGLNVLPYLADHGFHDMPVLPGSFYVELVRKLHRELFGQPAISLHKIEFERPVILTNDAVISVRMDRTSDQQASYTIYEATSAQVLDNPAQASCARLAVDLDAPHDSGHPSEDRPEKIASLESGTKFYEDLRRNGNQYGPAFQVFEAVSTSDSEIVGAVSDRAQATRDKGGLLSPPLLDAAPQLLSGFALTQGLTFILKSIEHLVVGESDGKTPWWMRAAHAISGTAVGNGLMGDVLAVDAAGGLLWAVYGITLAFIDRPTVVDSAAPRDVTAPVHETPLCVAATFTAEPLEDSLRFWGEQFARPVRTEFAPYNQVFQQLLDPTSAFRRNGSGANLIVLRLEDWLNEGRFRLTAPDAAKAAAVFGERPRAVLPNGLEIAHLNRYETDYVFQEIFVDQSYLRHDIQLADGDTVIDIGANIGLFSLFVMSRCRNPEIYAFEPSPRVYDLLRANCAAYGEPGRVKAFNAGVSEAEGRAQFTFYEHSSVFSSFHPDEQEDRAAIQAVVRNVVENELQGSSDVLEQDVEDLTASRLHAESIDCRLTSVADIIRENGLKKINLLKIDAEKSEMAILRGIPEEAWPMIEQIVMEVHDRSRAAVDDIEAQLTRRGFRCSVVEEKLLEDSGLFNIYATRRAPVAQAANQHAGLRAKVDEFCAALDSFTAAQPAPLILAIAPRTEEPMAEPALDDAEAQLLVSAGRHAQVQTIASRSIVSRYPVSQWHDAHRHQLADIPFTPEGYTALGTALSRALFRIDAPQLKVIALDCDHTLWEGTCGEVGPQGISIPPGYRYLQEFMIRQSEAGVLLALCSKNDPADVDAVFARRTDMPLRREHIAASQINWESKPANLRALAARLNLGLDAIVFIDDNPVECAAVRAACPEVTVLQLPTAADAIPAFLDHLWIFDKAATTREDRERSQWYQANAEREESRVSAPTLQDFLEKLQLRIEVTEPDDEQLARVAQLTLRTNQFNLTAVRRSETDLREFLASGGRCLVTSVSDRFGDYGLVGATLYTSAADRYVVDTLLLSCRALGKGVEHRMVSELATRALREGKAFVELSYHPTDRNEPARVFVEQLAPGRSLPKGTGTRLEFASPQLTGLRYTPDEAIRQSGAISGPSGSRPSSQRNLSTEMQRLGDELHSVEAVIGAMEIARRRVQPEPVAEAETESAAGAESLERALEIIWKKVLRRTSIGYHENFFDAGGTSLQAVGVIAMIRRELKKDVSIVALFECPTIALLAARLDESSGSEHAAAAAASAESRGRQRRHKVVKRKTAS